MIYRSNELEQTAVLDAAALMCAAARTAPKTRGFDHIVTLVLTGEDIAALAEKMKEIGQREFGAEDQHFTRDAMNVLHSQAVVLIGVKRVRYGLPYCGLCGFKNCAECTAANALCAFAPIDLGIAVSSAVGAAADLRIDNRIMFSAGKAAEEMGYVDEAVIWQGIPLSVTGKSIYFDRKPSSAKK